MQPIFCFITILILALKDYTIFYDDMYMKILIIDISFMNIRVYTKYVIFDILYVNIISLGYLQKKKMHIF